MRFTLNAARFLTHNSELQTLELGNSRPEIRGRRSTIDERRVSALDIGRWTLDIEYRILDSEEDMKGVRRLVFVVTVAAILGLLTRYALKSYSLELVHIVVVNAVAQKAHDDYPRSRIYETFSICREQIKKSQKEEQYMQQLLTLSHHLEKLQYLEDTEVDALLEDLDCN